MPCKIFSSQKIEELSDFQISTQHDIMEIYLRLLRKSNSPQKKKRPHVLNRRRIKGAKTNLQLSCKNGYWTNNLIQQAMHSHLNFIQRMLGADYIKSNEFIECLKKKGTPSMEDMLILYKVDDLQEVWHQFFRKKVMFRELMLSRTIKPKKLVYIKFQYRFEQAFKSGEFTHIAQ